MQQASYLEGGPLLWILPLYLHIYQKSNDDDDDDKHHFKCQMVTSSKWQCPQQYLCESLNSLDFFFFGVQDTETGTFGFIRNELPFWGFYRCVNSGESLTNLTQSHFGFM